MKTWFRFSVLALIWSIYYLAMHITGEILSTTDVIVCGIVIVVCMIIIIRYLYTLRGKRKQKILLEVCI